VKTKCRVGYHFYYIKSLRHFLIYLFTRHRVGHIIVSIQTPNGIAYYDSVMKENGKWFRELNKEMCPFDSFYEDTTLNLNIVDLLLPQDTERYSTAGTISHYICGYPRSPASCVSVVHRIRFLMNKQTKGRSPGGIYKYLRKELRHSARTTD